MFAAKGGYYQCDRRGGPNSATNDDSEPARNTQNTISIEKVQRSSTVMTKRCSMIKRFLLRSFACKHVVFPIIRAWNTPPLGSDHNGARLRNA